MSVAPRPDFGPDFGNEWLSNMHELAMPETVSYWPHGYGWWLLLSAAVVGLCIALYQYWRRWQAQAYRREAERYCRQAQQALDDANWLVVARSLPELVKRVMMQSHSREAVARLSGREWLEFLDQHIEQGGLFTQGLGRCLPMLAYGGDQQVLAVSLAERRQLLDVLAVWCVTHRGAAQ